MPASHSITRWASRGQSGQPRSGSRLDWRTTTTLRELSASLHDSGRSGLVTSVVMLDRARRTDYDPQDAVGCTGRDATNLPAI